MFKKYLPKSKNEDLTQATALEEHENSDKVYNYLNYYFLIVFSFLVSIKMEKYSITTSST